MGGMSSAQKTVLDGATSIEGERLSVVGTRVDGAHVLQTAPLLADTLPDGDGAAFEACEAPPLPDVHSQLQRQAEQLGERLQRRHEDAEHREGLLNAQRAAFDNELRSAQLWLDARHQEFAEREASLCQRQAVAAERDAKLAQRESIVAGREQELEWRLTRLKDTEQSLQVSRRQLEFERQTLRDQIDRQRGELNDEAERLADRATALAAAEIEHEQLEAQPRLDRQRLAEQQRRVQADLAEKRQSLARYANQLDRRRTALERARSELSRLYRETLEMRLATAELQVQLAGPGGSTVLVPSLTGLRQLVADQYRLEAAELVRQRSELERLKAELTAEHDKLRERQQELAGWVAQRETELNERAELLAAHSRDLARRTAHLGDPHVGAREERFGDQQELRRQTAKPIFSRNP
jgi:chromosome segregation ATPase